MLSYWQQCPSGQLPRPFDVYSMHEWTAQLSSTRCPLFCWDDSKMFAVNSCASLQVAKDALRSWSIKWQPDISNDVNNVYRKEVLYRPYSSPWKLPDGDFEVSDLGDIYVQRQTFLWGMVEKIAALPNAWSDIILGTLKIWNTRTLFKLFETYVRPIHEHCTP